MRCPLCKKHGSDESRAEDQIQTGQLYIQIYSEGLSLEHSFMRPENITLCSCSRGEAEVVESCGRSRSRGRTTQELASRYHELREIPALLVSAEARESSLALSGLATGPGLTGCLRRAHGWLEMQPTDLHSQPVIGPGGGGWSNYATGSRVSSAMPVS
ncbi:hypothetical protein H113_05870 [Trichophyton rubrum MR1459]|uniref:Uncharacterized protein n=1 Tax=Trichophyton rubrum CBS 288.86 TaxID=1215330 RepID=A0A022VXG1_TRIRU|nr:hypothetical protein H103_05829 [Trichophyton rubrum CBS 288.86]EZF61331.1 hypothetical protein H104_05815 [Trichophyton rubrum CBS 289.86]EZF82638.1 hypothetical protein H110_05823 [Trichophyton rubrum MR1448]EZF93340.1 hypothetical protein H113_05870 [Trichophyton rubrum MR1459]EZG04795.1 hypothetical protein H106_05666 [Trichophyton rubrum CBS 735.88]